MNNNTQLIYVYDPMCSWCWGFKECWQKIQAALADELEIIYKVGGLAADSDQPMPEHMQLFLQQTWQRISVQTGAKFNFDFWKVLVSQVGRKGKVLLVNKSLPN